jgi:hypothetical protein
MLPQEGHPMPQQYEYELPIEGQPPAIEMPMEGTYYESTPPAYSPPPQSGPALEQTPVRFNRPKLPPLPGQAQAPSDAASSANQPANLGLINPFRRQIRKGEAAVEVETKPITSTRPLQVGHQPIETTGRSTRRVDLAQSLSHRLAPAPAGTQNR